MAVAAPAVSFDEMVAQYSACERDELGAAYEQVELVERAAFLSKLSLAVAMDAGERRDGYFFLTMRMGCPYRSAEELLRIGSALRDLPFIASAYATGSLSWKHVALLTRFVEPEEDELWASRAAGVSLILLKQLGDEKEVSTQESEDAHVERRFKWRQRRSSVKFWGEVPLEQWAHVENAIDREAMSEGIDPVTGEFRDLAERRADALVKLASSAIALDSDPDRATVVVHFDADRVGADDTGLINGSPAPMSVISEFLCDARFQLIPEREGVPVGIGRISRTIPKYLERLLQKRDAGCRFPGCHNVRHTHGHHIMFWEHGGRTDLDNLILLCPRHHHLLHGGNWVIEGHPNGPVEFRSPDGIVITGRLPEASVSAQERIDQLTLALTPA
jgi:hypothetical protein